MGTRGGLANHPSLRRAQQKEHRDDAQDTAMDAAARRRRTKAQAYARNGSVLSIAAATVQDGENLRLIKHASKWDFMGVNN